MDFFTLLGEGIKRETTGDEGQRKSAAESQIERGELSVKNYFQLLTTNS